MDQYIASLHGHPSNWIDDIKFGCRAMVSLHAALHMLSKRHLSDPLIHFWHSNPCPLSCHTHTHKNTRIAPTGLTVLTGSY
eukprot:103959-Prorocentrum_minimum.AAC.1